MKSLLKFLSLFLPDKNGWRLVWMILPLVIIGWILFPVVPVTYTQWMVCGLIIMLWLDVMEIKDKLDSK
jgi:hypothetical protein